MMIKEFYAEFHDIVRQSSRDAYVHYEERHSYAEMYDYMRRLNAILADRKNQRIAIFSGKSFHNYSALFGVILSNNTWIPINPDLPETRNVEMLELARPEVILTDQELPPQISASAEAIRAKVVNLQEIDKMSPGPEFDISGFDKDDLSMIYFTSGSTGTPKGVPLTHENYILNVRNALRIMKLGRGEVFADYHELGFVISIPILFACIMSEGAFAPAVQKKDMMLPTNNMRANGVTVLISVPSTMARIRQLQPNGVEDDQLKLVIMCGEPLHLDILEYILSELGVDQVFDFYGSTEVATWTFCHECSFDDLEKFQAFGVVPIGKPTAGNMARIGEDNELWVSGRQITPGYLGGVGSEAFVEWEGERWYRTGDKVIVHDGHYLCKGRLDSQVKIGGYRIELMDTEAHLRSLEGIHRAICFVEGEGAQKSIVAALHASRDVRLNEVRAHLKDKLPPYMIPRKSFVINELPLNKSGKVDRLAIRAHYEDALS